MNKELYQSASSAERPRAESFLKMLLAQATLWNPAGVVMALIILLGLLLAVAWPLVARLF